MHKELDLPLLRAYIAVVEERQFVDAARRLKTSQSVISQRIKRIEDILGAQVMSRGRHGLSLTEVGEVLLEEARETITRSERAMKRVLDSVEGRTGRLKIGVAPWLLYGLVPSLLAMSRLQAPDRDIVFDTCNSSTQIEAILNDDLDAGLLITFDRPSSVATVPLFSVPTIVVMSSDNVLADKPDLDWKDLLTQSVIVPQYQSSSAFLDRLAASFRATRSSPRLVQRSGLLRSVMANIASGEGVGFVPDLPPIKAYGLEMRRLPDAPRVDVTVAYRRDDTRSNLLKLVELAKQNSETLRQATLGLTKSRLKVPQEI